MKHPVGYNFPLLREWSADTQVEKIGGYNIIMSPTEGVIFQGRREFNTFANPITEARLAIVNKAILKEKASSPEGLFNTFKIEDRNYYLLLFAFGDSPSDGYSFIFKEREDAMTMAAIYLETKSIALDNKKG